MPDSAKHPHLWIPEEEITDVSKKPQGRSNKYDVSYSEHGQVLSQGLQDVLAFFAKLQKSETVSKEDFLTFKVILQDQEDLADQRKFLEDEGMKINAVKDHNHAVVTAPRDVFDNLRDRVHRYRDKGIKQDFQYIVGFEPFTAEDKQAASLLRYFKEHPEALTVDVDMMIMPDLTQAQQEEYKNRVVAKIQKCQGKLAGEPYALSDGTPMIRAFIPSVNAAEIFDDPAIYRVEQTSFFQMIAPSSSTDLSNNLRINPEVNIDDLPTVVILDDGVNFPKGLEGVVKVHWAATGVKRTDSFGRHGTLVASKAAFANLGLQMASDSLTPRVRIIDAQIVDSEETPGNVMLSRIQEAVRTFAPVAKIFNFSYNAKTPIPGTRMSFLGCEMDLLTRSFGIRFTISAGNHRVFTVEDSLKAIYSDDDTVISEPADAMLGITVGAIVGQTHPGSVSERNDIAPYSRRGPGYYGFYKPDLVAYGATQFKNGLWPNDAYGLCLNNKGYCTAPGTSFTAPIVAGDLAQVLTSVPDNDIGLAQALLYNGALPLFDAQEEGLTQEHLDEASNLYGRGISSPENSMYSTENKVTFIHAGTLNRLTKKRVKFHIPSSIAEAKHKRGEDKVKVTVTCLAQPPVDRSRDEEYSAAYISASIHKLNSNGNNVTDNPSISDNRKKWDTCYHFHNEFSSFSSGDWEVWLELFTRWGIADDQEIPYSLVITVEDLLEENNLYSEVIKETAGRFRPVEPVRVTVRQ